MPFFIFTTFNIYFIITNKNKLFFIQCMLKLQPSLPQNLVNIKSRNWEWLSKLCSGRRLWGDRQAHCAHEARDMMWRVTVHSWYKRSWSYLKTERSREWPLGDISCLPELATLERCTLIHGSAIHRLQKVNNKQNIQESKGLELFWTHVLLLSGWGHPAIVLGSICALQLLYAFKCTHILVYMHCCITVLNQNPVSCHIVSSK